MCNLKETTSLMKAYKLNLAFFKLNITLKKNGLCIATVEIPQKDTLSIFIVLISSKWAGFSWCHACMHQSGSYEWKHNEKCVFNKIN